MFFASEIKIRKKLYLIFIIMDFFTMQFYEYLFYFLTFLLVKEERSYT